MPIVHTTVVVVSHRGPPEITTSDVEVDIFTSGHRRILYVDCTPLDPHDVANPQHQPNDDWMKKEPGAMSADELAFFQQVKENRLEIKQEGEEMNLMDVDEKVKPEDISRITKRFRIIGDSQEPSGSNAEGLGRATPADDSPDGILLNYLRQIVHLDLQRPLTDRIDTVRIKRPERDHWLALNGLQPKHLTLIDCSDTVGNLSSLDLLEHRWTGLESLRLEDISELLWDPEDWATSVNTVSAITLSYCTSLRLLPPGGFPNLTKLRIIENDALAMFAVAGDKLSGFSKRLEVLYLQSTNGVRVNFDDNNTHTLRFRDRLRKCKQLKDLTLILARGDQDIGLIPLLPASLENFQFHCSCSLGMLDDLEDWIKKPADRKWLPNLKSLTFRADAKTFDHRVPAQAGNQGLVAILDVPVPHGNYAAGDVSLDEVDKDALKVLGAGDIEEDDDDDADYEEDEAIETDSEGEDDDDESDDVSVKMEDDEEDEVIGQTAVDSHNPILLPHISSLIGTVLKRMKERNPELQISG